MSDTNETLDEGKQPLIQHLVELRSRLIKSLILITVMFVVAYIFADTIYNFLVQPYADAVQHRHMVELKSYKLCLQRYMQQQT